MYLLRFLSHFLAYSKIKISPFFPILKPPKTSFLSRLFIYLWPWDLFFSISWGTSLFGGTSASTMGQGADPSKLSCKNKDKKQIAFFLLTLMYLFPSPYQINQMRDP